MACSNAENQWKIYTEKNVYSSPFINTDKDKTWNGEFFFVQGADPQFGMIDVYGNKTSPEQSNWNAEIKLAELTVEKVNALHPRPRFFIICGDLVNQFPDTMTKIHEAQVKDFKNTFAKLNPEIPLICVCGNHDIGDSPTIKTVDMYRNSFGDDYFSFWCNGIFFLVLNSQYYKNRKDVLHLAEDQDQWLDRQLNEAKGNTIICFSHIPWFIKKHDEEETIFNIPEKFRINTLNKLHDSGVRYFFCGHYHRNCVQYYKEMEIIVTSAIGMQLGEDKSGLRIVRVSRNKIDHKYYELENMSTNELLTMD